jgi:hypothetical protein
MHLSLYHFIYLYIWTCQSFELNLTINLFWDDFKIITDLIANNADHDQATRSALVAYVENITIRLRV